MTAESKKKWWATMIERHGSKAAVRAFMAQAAKKAEHTGGGGFKYMSIHSPEKLRAISIKGGQKGKRT